MLKYIQFFISSIIGLVERKFTIPQSKAVGVYPSFLQMRKFELLAISNKLTNVGIRKIRKIGSNKEFDKITPEMFYTI